MTPERGWHMREGVPWVWEEYCKNKQDTFLYLQYKRILLGEFLSWVPFFFIFPLFFPVSLLVSEPQSVQFSVASNFLKLSFISWDKGMDTLSHLGTCVGKSIKWKEIGLWHLRHEDQSYFFNPYRKMIIFKYAPHLLLWLYGK